MNLQADFQFKVLTETLTKGMQFELPLIARLLRRRLYFHQQVNISFESRLELWRELSLIAAIPCNSVVAPIETVFFSGLEYLTGVEGARGMVEGSILYKAQSGSIIIATPFTIWAEATKLVWNITTSPPAGTVNCMFGCVSDRPPVYG